MELVFDQLTQALIIIIAISALVYNFILRPPSPAVHPLLLGRQSEPSRVRKSGESPIWGSSLNGGRALQRRTAASVTNVSSLALNNHNSHFYECALNISTALHNVFGLTSSQDKPVVIVSISYNEDLFITLLALSLLPVDTILVSTSVTEKLSFLPVASVVIADSSRVELLASAVSTSTIVYKSDSNKKEDSTLNGLKSQVHDEKKLDPVSAGLDDTFITFVHKIDNELNITRVPHGSFTAASVSIISLFPSAQRLTPKDRVLSFLDLNESLCNTSVPMTGLHVGTDVKVASHDDDLLRTARAFDPTVLFLSPEKLRQLNASITLTLSSHPLASWALHYKERLLSNGIVSNSTFIDNTLLKYMRIVFPNLRAVIVISAKESISQESLSLPRATLGVPVLSTLTHPVLSAGPILSSQFYDFQTFPDERDRSHHGCPVINGEIKVVDVEDATVDSGADPIGTLHFNSPSSTRLLDVSTLKPSSLLQGGNDVTSKNERNDDPTGVKRQWQDTHWRALMKSNGTVRMLF